MPHFVAVASTSDISPGEAKAFIVGDREVGVFNVDGTFYAIDNTCPHQGGPLADGWIDGCVVTCPWHSWAFDLRTGELIAMSGLSSVDVFDVRIDGSTIAVAAEPRR
ncbi:MAG: non-heme iron oxygenase ferredoxin subunit [Candidatus Eremiobacteraeota bacterium]|nr:non-heme iron oxygenase ferredoxin subunit [Candidatus Eremiobacteraeota bacterium]